jgi:hypothetical protein
MLAHGAPHIMGERRRACEWSGAKKNQRDESNKSLTDGPMS